MHTHAARTDIHRHCLQLSMVFTLCLLVMPAMADSLKSSTIKSFMASQQEVTTVLDQIAGNQATDFSDDDEDWNMDFTSVYSGFVDELSNHPPTLKKVSDVVESHGFENLEQWSRIGDRIFTAYMAIDMEGQPAVDTGAMESYMASLEEGLPEADMQNIRTMMEGAISSSEMARNAPVRDIEAVRPHIAEVRALYETEAR